MNYDKMMQHIMAVIFAFTFFMAFWGGWWSQQRRWWWMSILVFLAVYFGFNRVIKSLK